MSKCPDCGTIQHPPRDIEDPNLQYCSNPDLFDASGFSLFNFLIASKRSTDIGCSHPQMAKK
jgi:hypothetical protein